MTIIVIVTSKYHIKFTSDYFSGIQKLHNKIVPRIGGVPIFLSIVIVYFILNEYQFTQRIDIANNHWGNSSFFNWFIR